MNVNESLSPSHKQKNGKSILKVLFSVFFLLINSCDVEKYGEVGVSMDPPLGLSSVQITNTIHLEFWALNNESFFQGFDIRFITNVGVAHSNLNGIAVPNSGEDPTSVTMSALVPNPTARFFTFDVAGYPRWITETNVLTNIEVTGSLEFLTNITNEITNYATNEAFVGGQTYVFGVRAYTSLYAPYYSEFGNLTSLTFTN